jgi:asparagine synthase (glutamine-hydrolysing)
MCGIAGIISGINKEETNQQLLSMSTALRHRGPNGQAIWQNDAGTVGFAHRRLAIIDLSAASDQPLHYLHYTIVFNGEIYNYQELKKQLQSHGYKFTTNGDTEVLPAAYDFWGTDFLHQLDGMFAFALYDAKKQTILLARDRFGEKPLYYSPSTTANQPFYFASEMKALWAAGVPKEPNNGMLLNFLTLGYVQNPTDKSATFYQQILSLPPAHSLLINLSEGKQFINYWYQPRFSSSSNAQISEASAIEKFGELLLTSVGRRLRADVPVGTSLSGGLDSSSIVALIHQLKQNHAPLQQWSNVCFSAIFPGFEKDEAVYSKQVADNFGIKQYTVTPTAADLITQWQQLVYHQEEPFQSSSVFTQYSVYGLAKQHGVTVLLDGQGADETLSGYKKYSHWYLQQLLASNPSLFKKEKTLLQQHNLLEQWGAKNYLATFLPGYTAKALTSKAAQQQTNHPHIHRDFLQQNFTKTSLYKPLVKSLEDLLHYNTFSFGLEELLRYADRNSMAHSREVRLPFLQHELVEFIFSLPSHFKIKHGFTKWILRQSMDKLLPKNIVWRTDKVGFEPPQQQWMEQPAMQEMIMESRKTLAGRGILKNSVINVPFQAKSAHEVANYDWRYVSAAAMF